MSDGKGEEVSDRRTSLEARKSPGPGYGTILSIAGLVYGLLGFVIAWPRGWPLLLLWVVAGVAVATLLVVFCPDLPERMNQQTADYAERKRENTDQRSVSEARQAFSEARPRPVAKPGKDRGGFDGTFLVDIVGESRYQDVLERICGGRSARSARVEVEAVMIPETDNPHDSHAVRIEIQGETVGHFSRHDAKLYRRRLKAAGAEGRVTRCPAIIVGGWDRPGSRGHFGVKLDLDPFDEE